jgi:hypothetical protein
MDKNKKLFKISYFNVTLFLNLLVTVKQLEIVIVADLENM